MAATPANIVAAKINPHQVLGAFFWMPVTRFRFIFVRSGATVPRTCNRIVTRSPETFTRISGLDTR